MMKILVTCVGLLTLLTRGAFAQSTDADTRSPGEFEDCYPLEMNDPRAPKEELRCGFKEPVTDQAERVRQGDEPTLTVQIRSGGTAPRYRLVKVEQRRSTGDRDFVRLKTPLDADGRPREVEFQIVREYDVRLIIDDDAPPRDYDLYLVFEAAGQAPQRRQIRLHVAPSKNDKYVIASAGTPPTIISGQSSPLVLHIENRFPTYHLRVKSISMTTDPPGLVESRPIERTEVVANGQLAEIKLDVTGRAPLSWLLTPVNDKPTLKVSMTYDDGFRRDIRRVPDMPIEFKVDFKNWVILSFAALSVVIGSVVGSMLRGRKLPTLANGLRSLILSAMVVLLVLVGQVEVISVGKEIPLHKPIMTLLISFVVSLFDPRDVVDKLRSLFSFGKPSAASKGAPV